MIKKLDIFIVPMMTILLASSSVNAQDHLIQGVVTTFDSIRLIDVEVQNRSTKQIVTTDSLGRFTIQAEKNDKLKVGATGFFNEKVKIGEKTKLVAVNLKLKPGDKNKEYAIGNLRVDDIDKLNALSNLNTDDLDFSQYTDIYDILRGRFSGVRIVNGEVIVRGKSTFDSQDNSALIVVDGVMRDESALSNIPTDQVKSISVIKDGSSAIYGVNGANGVVEIETKSGSDIN